MSTNCTKVTFEETDGIGRRCRKRARLFGMFAGGGFCVEHAKEIAEKYGAATFHPEFRALLGEETT